MTTASQGTVLGAPDPLIAGDREPYCSSPSRVIGGMRVPFRCTRARGHLDRRVTEHVASAPHESRLPVAVAAWDATSGPRIVELNQERDQ